MKTPKSDGCLIRIWDGCIIQCMCDNNSNKFWVNDRPKLSRTIHSQHPHTGRNVEGCKSRPLPTSNVCHYHMARSVIRWKVSIYLEVKYKNVESHWPCHSWWYNSFPLTQNAHLLYNMPYRFFYTVFLNTIEQQDYLEHVKRIRKNNISLCTYRVVDIEYHISIPYK